MENSKSTEETLTRSSCISSGVGLAFTDIMLTIKEAGMPLITFSLIRRISTSGPTSVGMVGTMSRTIPLKIQSIHWCQSWRKKESTEDGNSYSFFWQTSSWQEYLWIRDIISSVEQERRSCVHFRRCKGMEWWTKGAVILLTTVLSSSSIWNVIVRLLMHWRSHEMSLYRFTLPMYGSPR